jgi:hypothetical protein
MSVRQHRERPGKISGLKTLDGAPDWTVLAPSEVAALSGAALVTLRLWKRQGRGPKQIRIEGRPRYRLGDVREWLNGASA